MTEPPSPKPLPERPLNAPRRSASSSPSSSSKKSRARTPRCQVEGCKVDLTDAKPYYSKHKVCSAHSKFPQVVVSGVHQRFCQQCSRFHLLSEFDSEKRSCRKRLANHNERRRKPPPGSLLSPHYTRLSSSTSGNSSRSAGFQIDLPAAYPRPPSTAWSNVLSQSSDQGPRNQTASLPGKFLPWQRLPPHPPYEMFMPNSTSSDSNGFAGHQIHSGECFMGVTAESSCALSLLSNQPWNSRNPVSPGLGISNIMCCEGSCSTTSTPIVHNPVDVGYPKTPFSHSKGHEAGELEYPQQSRKLFQEQHQSTRPVHWSL